MSHRVALAFEDGVTRFVTCAEDQTVTDASYRARINIPMDCRDGVCGTCKAFCESGDFDRGSYLEEALAPDEERAGYVLTCQLKPRSDLVLQIASTSAVARTGAATHRGTVTGLDRLSATTVALTIEIPDRAELAFLPGQYVNIAIPGTSEERSYSFSNGPDDEALTFLVKLTPGGVMSSWLTDRARVGDDISFTGPHGSFFLRESDSPLLLLAGGTGLAPILSILRALDAGRQHPADAPGLRRHDRRRRGRAGDDRSARRIAAEPEVGLLRRRPGHAGAEPGVRDVADRARNTCTTVRPPSISAARRRWSTRCAATSASRASRRPGSSTSGSRAPLPGPAGLLVPQQTTSGLARSRSQPSRSEPSRWKPGRSEPGRSEPPPSKRPLPRCESWVVTTPGPGS